MCINTSSMPHKDKVGRVFCVPLFSLQNWAMQLLAVDPLLRLYNISPHTSRRMIQQFLGSASGPTAGRKHQFLSHSWAQSCPRRRMWKRQWTISRLGKWKLTLSFNFVCICLSYFFSLIKIHWEHGWGPAGEDWWYQKFDS